MYANYKDVDSNECKVLDNLIIMLSYIATQGQVLNNSKTLKWLLENDLQFAYFLDSQNVAKSGRF